MQQKNALITYEGVGAADRTWTGTVSLPRDFKSLVSAYSTTAAFDLKYYTALFIKCQAFLKKYIEFIL